MSRLHISITKLLLHRTFIPLRQQSWYICTEAAEDIYAIMTQYDEQYSMKAVFSTAT